MVASDGGIFNYGTSFYGSLGGQPNSEPDRRAWRRRPTVAATGSCRALPRRRRRRSGPAPAAPRCRRCSSSSTRWATGSTPRAARSTTAPSRRSGRSRRRRACRPTASSGRRPGRRSQSGVRPTPQSASRATRSRSTWRDDLLMVVNNGQLVWTLNTSTGGGYTYTQDGQTSVATTPTGVFQTFRVVDGTVTDSLGTLYRPRFFYEGFAIHGDSDGAARARSRTAAHASATRPSTGCGPPTSTRSGRPSGSTDPDQMS